MESQGCSKASYAATNYQNTLLVDRSFHFSVRYQEMEVMNDEDRTVGTTLKRRLEVEMNVPFFS